MRGLDRNVAGKGRVRTDRYKSWAAASGFSSRSISASKAEAQAKKGVAVLTQPDIRWGRCDIKTVGLLANVLAKQAAREAGAYEAWMVDEMGLVTEGSSTNAWIVNGQGDVITRDLSHAILPGVTRKIMLDAMKDAQLKVVERKFTVAEALAAREAFISSATGAAVPVVMIDGQRIGDGTPGALTRRIRDLYAEKAGIE